MTATTAPARKFDLLRTFHTAVSSTGRDYREELGVDDNAAEYALAAQEGREDVDLLDLVDDTEVRDLRSPGQRSFMDDLIGRLTRLDPATGAQAREFTDLTTGKGGWTPGRDGNASEWIDRMIRKEAALKVNRPAEPTTGPVVDVAPGRYAVEEDGTLKFFHLRYGKDGTRWAGFTFLDIQASADLHPIKDRARKARIIALIAQDTEAASRRYGQELGVCGRCGRVLTDEESRAYGIGPICRDK